MKRSEALALVAILEAAFPAGGHGEETAEFYVSKFERYDTGPSVRAVNRLTDERESTFFPAWAEIRGWIEHYTPQVKQLEEAPGVPPPPEVRVEMAKLSSKLEDRHSVILGERDKWARACWYCAATATIEVMGTNPDNGDRAVINTCQRHSARARGLLRVVESA